MFIDCSEIIPERLWVGAHVRPEHLSQLRQMGITTVLSLQSDEDLAYYGVSAGKAQKAYQKAEIEIKRIPVPDFDKEALARTLPEIVEALKAVLKPRWARVYLHCSAGINRGPTVAAAYLIRTRGMPAREAYEYIVAHRDCSPYLSLLEEYEVSLKT